MLTQLSMVMSALNYAFCLGLNGEDRALMAVPSTHVTGWSPSCWAMSGGWRDHLSDRVQRGFLALAAKERMTYTLMVPAMYICACCSLVRRPAR